MARECAFLSLFHFVVPPMEKPQKVFCCKITWAIFVEGIFWNIYMQYHFVIGFASVVCWSHLQTVCTQIRPYKMLSLADTDPNC